jgi:hypothetical protein
MEQLKLNINIEGIIEIILEEKQYVFKDCNDQRIYKVFEALDQRNITYAETSQTGYDLVIGIKGTTILRKHF